MGHPGTSHDWRDAEAYLRLLEVDRAGIMWEWLRRDPEYIAWHAPATAVASGTSLARPHPNEDPVQWGLHFRRASGRPSTGGQGALACRF